MRKIGADKDTTIANILDSAKEEFLTKGYQGASLREIATKAGVTTGAIYCFFNGKEDILDKIASSVIEPMIEFVSVNMANACKISNPNINNTLRGDVAMADYIIESFYNNRDIWHIIINNITRPTLNKYMTDFLSESTKYYQQFFSMMPDDKGKNIDISALRTFSHMQFNTMLTIAAHDFDKAEIKKNVYDAMHMLRAALYSLLDTPICQHK